jgi:S-formylglutathione hydrolase
MERVEQHASFGGRQEVWKHASAVLCREMKFGIYLPEPCLEIQLGLRQRCPSGPAHR